MRIPMFYCPHCKRFKNLFQVTNVDAYDYGNCKHCGTECVETRLVLEALIKREVERAHGTQDE